MQTSATTPHGADGRLHALDATRAAALLGGVVLHGVMSFMPGMIGWPGQDVSTSPAANVIFFVIHVFRMTSFFLIAGFFARLALQKKGLKGFVLDRLKRIGIPMVVGWPILMAAIIGCYIWGFSQIFPNGPPPEAAAAQAEAKKFPPIIGFPLGHLWFLWVLTLLYVSSLVLRGVVVLVDRGGHLRRFADTVVKGLVRSHLLPFVLAAPVFAALVWGIPRWPMWFGIPTPDSDLVPNLAAVAAFGSAFVLGWLLHRSPELLQVWARRWALNLAVAAGLIAAYLGTLGVQFDMRGTEDIQARIPHAALFSVTMWFTVQAFVGTMVRFLTRENKVIRYLADASYWIYLVHLPLLMAMQILIMRIELTWLIKFPAMIAVAMALMLLSYEHLVRYSFIGAVLNGRRRRSPRAPAAAIARQPA